MTTPQPDQRPSHAAAPSEATGDQAISAAPGQATPTASPQPAIHRDSASNAAPQDELAALRAITRLLGLGIPIATLASGLTYLLGRVYVTNYYGEFGISFSALQFSTADFLFASTDVVFAIFIAAAIAWLGFRSGFSTLDLFLDSRRDRRRDAIYATLLQSYDRLPPEEQGREKSEPLIASLVRSREVLQKYDGLSDEEQGKFLRIDREMGRLVRERKKREQTGLRRFIEQDAFGAVVGSVSLFFLLSSPFFLDVIGLKGLALGVALGLVLALPTGLIPSTDEILNSIRLIVLVILTLLVVSAIPVLTTKLASLDARDAVAKGRLPAAVIETVSDKDLPAIIQDKEPTRSVPLRIVLINGGSVYARVTLRGCTAERSDTSCERTVVIPTSAVKSLCYVASKQLSSGAKPCG